jgi:hypothetical protein
LLHLPTENGSLHSVQQQKLLRGIPRHMRTTMSAIVKDEESSWRIDGKIQSTRLL